MSSLALVSLAQEVHEMRRPRLSTSENAKEAATVAEELNRKAKELRAKESQEEFLAGPSAESDTLRDEIAVLLGRLVDHHPRPGPIPAHDRLNPDLYEAVEASSSPLAGFTYMELFRAVEDLDEAGVRTSDVYPVLAVEIASRVNEFDVQQLVRIAAIMHRHGVKDAGFYSALASHVSLRSREARPVELVELLEVVNREGAEGEHLAAETSAKYAHWEESPSCRPDSRGFVRFVRAVIESGHAPATFLWWAEHHIATHPERLHESDLDTVLRLIEVSHSISEDTRRKLAADARRRAHDKVAAQQSGDQPEWFGLSRAAQAV